MYMYFVFIEGQGYNFGLIERGLPCTVSFKVGVTVFFLHVEVSTLIFPREGMGFAYNNYYNRVFMKNPSSRRKV